MRNAFLLALLALGTGGGCATASEVMEESPADLMVEWNETILDLAEREDGFMTLKGVRAAAMLHLAAHDSLAGISGRYATYAHHVRDSRANPVVAANEAAFNVAVNQYPDRAPALSELRDRWLDTVAAGDRRDAGIRLGRNAAAAVLASREGDGWDGEAEYRWHPMAPGVYAEFREHSGTPEGFIFGAGWAGARGFALTSPDQFRSPPPPSIDSAEYTKAFREVKDVGRFQSMSRSPDQTHLALWWKDFAESSHNRLARDLVSRENLSLSDAARLFALINMGVFDAYVSSFDNKFFYNHWRPYTAIRWAANDENPDTEAEPTWTNTHNHTYAFPSYPSAHGTACAAAMSAFIDVFGDELPIEMRIPQVDIAGPFSGKIDMQPPVRSFGRFSDAAMECALSRIYLGIHFRYDSTAGYALGRQVGQNVVSTTLERQ